VSLSPEDASQNLAPESSKAETTSAEDAAPLVWERATSPVQAEQGSAPASEPKVVQLAEPSLQRVTEYDLDVIPYAPIDPIGCVPLQSDPAWNGWDIVRLVFLTIVALVVGVLAVMFVVHLWIYPHTPLADIARIPLVAVAGQCVAYLLVLAYMWVLVARERRRPDVLNAIHWNWPSKILGYVMAGFALSVGLQGIAHFLPIPKDLPIDSFFRTPAEAWALGILSVTLAPLMEELFFRGFLYPVLARSLGLPGAVFLTALAFALLHGAQLMFSWGPVLIIFLVGLVLTMVRAKKNSVATSLIIHMAYNGTIFVAMFFATDGFRHLERLNP
jgi:uncharacterized protein